MPTLIIFFNIVVEDLARASSQEKENQLYFLYGSNSENPTYNGIKKNKMHRNKFLKMQDL
jgi:hypothetical protein